MRRFYVQKVLSLFFIGFLIFVYSYKPPDVPTSTKPVGVKLLVLMYHGFCNDSDGESTYVIDAKKFEEDILYLKEKNFTFVNSKDLTDYCDNQKYIGDKCVMITIDDGYLNNLVYACPIIERQKVKVTISPIGYYSDYHTKHNDTNLSYAHMTWPQIQKLSQSGYVDIQNHSYNMHSLNGARKGSARAKGESKKDYIRAFFDDLSKAHTAIETATGKAPVTYVYPFGSVSKPSKEVLKCFGYRLSLGCEEGYNYITDSPDSLFELKRFNRSDEKNIASVVGGY